MALLVLLSALSRSNSALSLMLAIYRQIIHLKVPFSLIYEARNRSYSLSLSGEILIRGPSVTKGYYKRDDLNNDRSIFTEDGWFRTGDVGQWNPDGTLSVIDRIKNLVKLSGGEVSIHQPYSESPVTFFSSILPWNA